MDPDAYKEAYNGVLVQDLQNQNRQVLLELRLKLTHQGWQAMRSQL